MGKNFYILFIREPLRKTFYKKREIIESNNISLKRLRNVNFFYSRYISICILVPYSRLPIPLKLFTGNCKGISPNTKIPVVNPNRRGLGVVFKPVVVLTKTIFYLKQLKQTNQ